MADHHYEFNVKMACGGCSGAIDRVLKKTDGRFTTWPITPHSTTTPRFTPTSKQWCPWKKLAA